MGGDVLAGGCCDVQHDVTPVKEFTSRIQTALRRFENNEEELQRVVGEIVAEIEVKSADGKFRPTPAPKNNFSGTLPPNMRME